MSQDEQPSRDEVIRAMLAVRVPALPAWANLDPVFLMQLAQTTAMQSQIQSVIAHLPQFQVDYSKLIPQVDLSRMLIADQLLDRLGAQTVELNRQLLRQVTYPATEIANQMVRALAPSTQLIESMQAQIRAVTSQIDQSVWRYLEPLREIAERVGRSEAVRDAFVAYGLWLAPLMSEELVQRIVTLHSRGANSGVVHSLVSRYYAKDNWALLDSVVEGCRGSRYVAQRCEAMSQALKAHRQGLYAVSVPALLVHIEGIAADYVKANKLLPKIGPKTKEIVVAALEGTPCSLFDVREYASVTALLAYIQGSMYMFVDFDKQHRALHHEKRLVAHAIRHGRQISYGSRMNSLRLFLMIDVLSLLN